MDGEAVLDSDWYVVFGVFAIWNDYFWASFQWKRYSLAQAEYSERREKETFLKLFKIVSEDSRVVFDGKSCLKTDSKWHNNKQLHKSKLQRVQTKNNEEGSFELQGEKFDMREIIEIDKL